MQKLIDFSKYSSIQIGPCVNVTILDEIQTIPKDWTLIGACNNLLIPPSPPPLAKLGKNFSFIRLEKNALHVGAATKSGQLLSFARKNNLGGFELLQKLPGTLGGIVKMNAGLKSWEIFNNFEKILTDEGWISKQDIDYKYRYTLIEGVIYEIVFKLKKGFDEELLSMFKTMRENQPSEPSCGSCFKNPPQFPAGQLLEEVGFRGKSLGNMAFSQQHSNFLINLRGGTYEEAINLISLAQKTVLEKSGVVLVPEINIIKPITKI